jgi:DNA-binding protein H-NS
MPIFIFPIARDEADVYFDATSECGEAMMSVDLDAMSKDELQKLRKETDRKLKDYDERRKADARSAAEKAVKEYGFSLEELVGSGKRGAAKSVPRYRHPENSSKTWTGRGRKPSWVIAHIEGGGALEDLAI